MRLAVIADIHGNYIALEAALSLFDTLDLTGVLFLGDYVSDCPYPERTLALLKAFEQRYPCWFVRGNREESLLAHAHNPNDGWCASSATGSLLYTYEHLTAEDLTWFSTMPNSMDVSFGSDAPFTLCHGSPGGAREWIKGDDERLDHYTRRLPGRFLLCGHTHGSQIDHMNGKTILFCPSLGMPHIHDTDARVTLLERSGKDWHVRFISVPCDLSALYPAFDESGLADMGCVYTACARRELALMRPVCMAGVRMAARLAREDGWPGQGSIPERYWRMVAEKLDEL